MKKIFKIICVVIFLLYALSRCRGRDVNAEVRNSNVLASEESDHEEIRENEVIKYSVTANEVTDFMQAMRQILISIYVLIVVVLAFSIALFVLYIAKGR